MKILKKINCFFISSFISLVLTSYTHADTNVEFDSSFFSPSNDGSKVDVTQFSRGNPVLAGEYNVDIFVNNVKKKNSIVKFIANSTPVAKPCLTYDLLLSLDIKPDKLSEPKDQSVCIDIEKVLDQSHVEFSVSEQKLTISLPQVYINQHPKDYVNPKLWDKGINAALLSYDLNTYSSRSDHNTSRSSYLGLNYGFNVDGWHFRARGSSNWSDDEGPNYDSQDIYLQHNLAALKSQFMMGDVYTPGDTFDSVNVRGIRLYSDSRMQPSSATNYAPVIRGIANSNAKVTIKQNGNTIYETTVSQGPFALEDINPTGYGNDLDVTIEEADGSKRKFSVPYSSVAQLERSGQSKFDISLGQLKDDSLEENPKVAIASGYYGITGTTTLYSGTEIMDDDYKAILTGIAQNTMVGAFAFDVTQSYAKISNIDLTGQSYRISYDKLIESSNTSLNVAAYKFSTENYLSLQDAARLKSDLAKDIDNENYNNISRMRNQVQINIDQPLSFFGSEQGSLYLTGSWESYWSQENSTSQYSLGYSNSFRWGSYNLSLQRAYDEYGKADDRAYISFNIPLNNFFGNGPNTSAFNNLTTGVSTNFKGDSQMDMSTTGYSPDNRYNYSVNASSDMSQEQNPTQIGGYGSYNSAYGPESLSASFDADGGRQISFGSSGGAIFHEGDITFAPGSIGDSDTLALVEAKGAQGAKVTTGEGQVDKEGYAIIPDLSPYKENTIGLDISTLKQDVEVENTSSTVIPDSSAIVLIHFKTDDERSVLLELNRSDNGFIPLGANVYNSRSELVGNVGQAGRAFVRGIDDKGNLTVIWGGDSSQRCIAEYSIPKKPKMIRLTILLSDITCNIKN